MDRAILHCDMNNFYASVERLYDSRLEGKAVAVCGDREMRHGIVLAKSEAAKKCGIKTGDTVFLARNKCPELIVVEPHFDRYVLHSRIAREIYCQYTDQVESLGLDECWLDVTASRRAFGPGEKIGQELRRRMREETGLTISVGVSFNKIFAKLGSDMKKPDAMTVISREDFPKTVWPLPVESLFGVGRESARTLHRFGIHTVGALAGANDRLLQMKFGKTGAMLKAFARGEDLSPVLPCDFESPMKSVGHGLTTPQDLTEPDQVWTLILHLSQCIGEKLRFHQMQAEGVAIECKDRNFFTKTLQKQLPQPTDCTMTLAKEAFALFRERYLFREPLRSVTVRAISLRPKSDQQLSLFTQTQDLRYQVLDRVSDEIRNRWGQDALKPASLLQTKLPEKSGYVPFQGPPAR